MSVQSDPQFNYQVGGSLSVDYPAYVERQCDRELCDRLLAGEYCFVFNSRQMGKSSLRVRTMQKLANAGVACAVIDPQTRGTTLREDQWYAGTIKRLIEDLGLSDAIAFSQWWKDLKAQDISAVERFHYFIDRVLLVELLQPIVIFVEEIDNLLSLKFDTDGFFGLIRNFHEQRAEKPKYERLTFAFLGVATPSDLIVNKESSAFNIGYPVEMYGFELEEAMPLLQGLEGRVENPLGILEEVLYWTNGQPFLTQRVLKLVVQGLDEGVSPRGLVEEVVRTQIIANWETRDLPAHLKTIRDRLLRSRERLRRQLLGLYRRILEGNEVEADESDEQLQLRLTGLVVRREGRLQGYNPIYAEVFDLSWVDGALAELPPPFYWESIAAWLKAPPEEKELFLLRGQEYLDAEARAQRKKNLGHDEQRFLDACYKLAKQHSEDKKRRAARRLWVSSTIAVLAMAAMAIALVNARNARQELAKTKLEVEIIEAEAEIIEAEAAKQRRHLDDVFLITTGVTQLIKCNRF
ncbi:MAG: AAA-like domain-containing protein [Spirulina sp.]